ncbi:MAG TPA: nickel pincer cofactor biosynthesis protein LarB [Syntrophales bacterium]|nr:nickel pincer cofactor biosynthesis protein LarB [Syntrophales bacterium]HOL59531.1 nickel pincer cofactor biosynthesis protein LarB [Syntrophales bacterium]HPO35621.1 nickel pincer cofactor biosynthesis protein LarB [Syntrophales bacterium]
MNKAEVFKILSEVQAGRISAEEGMAKLEKASFLDLGFAKIDVHRERRTGYGEVIFCPGKTKEQIKAIFNAMLSEGDSNILATRADESIYDEIKGLHAGIKFHPLAKMLTLIRREIPLTPGYISILSAGTSDLPVAEEAAITAEFFGNRVERIYDVGVAGVHRLFANLEKIRGARVCVVVAGMEGALPSIVGGLIDKPIIAVPTSVGYGASFQGLAALMAMLNSCAPGVTVVNIDNGFGAGLAASKINKLP